MSTGDVRIVRPDQGPHTFREETKPAIKPISQEVEREARATAHALSPAGDVVTHAVKRQDEKNFLEEEREAKRKAAEEEKHRKSIGLTVASAVDAVKHVPKVASQGATLGSEAVSLVWEQPDRVNAVLKAILSATKEGTALGVKQRHTFSSAVEHAKEGYREVQEVHNKAPESSEAAFEKAKEAVTDLAKGVQEPSIKKLGASTVESAESAGGTVEAAAAAPSDAFGVVREAIVTSVTTISVPFRAPIQSAKAAWTGTVAATTMAGLATAAPAQVGSAFTALSDAAKEVGSTVGIVMEASNRMLGGQLAQRIILIALLPLLLVPALSGLVFGISFELAGRVISFTFSFIASCLASAARVLAWRFPATTAVKGNNVKSHPIGVTQEDESFTQPLNLDHAPAGDNEDDLLNERVSSLAFGPAREAFLAARQHAQEEEAAAKAPLRVVGGALAMAGRATQNAFGRLIFWVQQPQPQHTTDTGKPTIVPSTEAGLAQHGSDAAHGDVGASNGGYAIDTPAGPLLPIIALGMEDGPYFIPGPYLRLRKPSPSTPPSSPAEPSLTTVPTIERPSTVSVESATKADYLGDEEMVLQHQQQEIRRGAADEAAAARAVAAVDMERRIGETQLPPSRENGASTQAARHATLVDKLKHSISLVPYWIMDGVDDIRFTAQLLLNYAAAIYAATIDTATAVVKTAVSRGHEPLVRRFEKFCTLAVQIPVLGSAAMLASADTMLWRISGRAAKHAARRRFTTVA